MAGRIRTIKPELLEDEKASALSDAAWRLFVSSWLLCDDHGRFRAGARYLAAMVWQDTTKTAVAEKALVELAEAGRVRIYRVDGDTYAEIPTWARHQRIDNAGKEGKKVPIPTPESYVARDSGYLAYVSPRTSASLGDSPLEPPNLAALPPTSDLRPPTNGTLDPSGGSAAPPGPAPRPPLKAKPDKPPPSPTLPGIEPKTPKPESPEGTVWRVWLELYVASHYRRGYSRAPEDGKAVRAYAANARAQLEADQRPPEDLEPLVRHQLRAYLADQGSRDFPLRDHGHGLRWLAHGLPTYGTPWARAPAPAPIAAAQERRPTGHSPACKPLRCVCSLAVLAPKGSGLPDVERPPHVDVAGMFRGQA